ncbi:MAG: hypothetical protein ACPH3C_06380, partial [Glaciecola sp.]
RRGTCDGTTRRTLVARRSLLRRARVKEVAREAAALWCMVYGVSYVYIGINIPSSCSSVCFGAILHSGYPENIQKFHDL